MAKKETAAKKSVDDYLKPLPVKVRKTLEELRKVIKSAAPDAEELISYQIPTYKQNGPLVHFAAFAKHCSLVVVNKELIKLYAEELKAYKTSGTTVQFTSDHPLDATLVKKIVTARIAQNLERVAGEALVKKSSPIKKKAVKKSDK